MRRRSAALLLVAGFHLTFPMPGGSEEVSDLLLPGQPRERAIAAEEAHVYRVEVGEEPVLVLVEQQGIDLVVEARGPAGQETLTVDAPNSRWGPEVLVLPAGNRYRVEVGPGQKSVPPGLYTIQAEALGKGTERSARRAAALAAMSRAGQLVPGPAKARSEALSAYREALKAWRGLGERHWEAEILFVVAVLEKEAGDSRAAIGDFQRALALWRELAKPRRQAAALNALGLARRRGETETARGHLEEALALWQSLGERSEEEGTRSDLCLLEQVSGALPSALACFQGLLRLHQGRGNPSAEATALNNLGGIYHLMGEPDAALDRLRKALALREDLGELGGQAQTLNNVAVVHRALGEWQEALRVYSQVGKILESLDSPEEEAKVLNNIGFTYNSLGEPERALSFLQRALKLRLKVGDGPGEAITLNNLGLAWSNLGDLERALERHREALERVIALRNERQEAITRLRLAEVHLEMGDPSAALPEIAAALAHLRQTGLRREEVQALHLCGRALAMAGRPREAKPVLLEALGRRRALRDRAGEVEVLHTLATVEQSLGLLDDARAYAEEAVARVELLRTGFVSPDLRAAFMATQRRAYALVIDLLMDRHAADPHGGHDRAAFQVSERARGRSLLDALHSGGDGRARSAVPADLLERRQSLRRRLSAKAYQQLGGGEGSQAETLQRETEALLADLHGVEAEIRRSDPRYAELSQPPSLGSEEVAGLLEPGTLLLEYSLGDKRSFLWAVGTGGLRTFLLPPQSRIEALAREAYREMSQVETGSGAGQQEAAKVLGRILLEPVWSEAARYRRLVVVPDGALHFLPFGALSVADPGRSWDAPGDRKPLLEMLEVVYLPSATTLALQRQRLERRPPAPKWAAILADPVFSPHDRRLSGCGKKRQPEGEAGSLLPQFIRLPFSRHEAEEIARLAPAGQVWSAFDLAASREVVLSGELRPYRVIHFATHGVADTRNPELSGLVLSLVDAACRPREGFLGLPDIYELDLAADLVVLSGCRTALGKAVRGEGLMGLTRGFLYAGVPRVVGSLWPVQDRTTAALMSRFYRAMWRDGLTPAAALREAQRSLRREPRYRDSFSWAGFVLQGDWR